MGADSFCGEGGERCVAIDKCVAKSPDWLLYLWVCGVQMQEDVSLGVVVKGRWRVSLSPRRMFVVSKCSASDLMCVCDGGSEMYVVGVHVHVATQKAHDTCMTAQAFYQVLWCVS